MSTPTGRAEHGATAGAVSWTGHSGRSNRTRRAIDADLWARVVAPVLVAPGAVRDWAPEIVDAGFGIGDSVLSLAAEQPTTRVLGVETYPTGVLRVAKAVAAQGLTSVRLSDLDVREIVPALAPGSLREFRLFFPDPWPKRRHEARRLVTPDFLGAVVETLRPGGIFWFATDADHYALQVRSLAAARSDLVAEPAPPSPRPQTKYAAIATRAGRTCRDLVWRRSAQL